MHTLKTTFPISLKLQTSKLVKELNHAIIRNVECTSKIIAGGNRGPLLILMPLHRNVIFAIEYHFSSSV